MRVVVYPIRKGVENITNLAEIRKAKGFTQESLAKASGVSRVTIARIETGRQNVSGKTLIAIAMALDMSVDSLIGEAF